MSKELNRLVTKTISYQTAMAEYLGVGGMAEDPEMIGPQTCVIVAKLMTRNITIPLRSKERIDAVIEALTRCRDLIYGVETPESSKTPNS